jgi:outer membrane protein assembly factor BamB
VGELLRQSGDLSGAEAALERSVSLASRLVDPERARDEELASYKALGRLYLEWAERLESTGAQAEAAAKFEKAVELAVTPGAKVTALLARARLREKMGQTVAAQSDYAHIAAEEQANRLMVPGGEAGFDHTLAAEATAALWRLRGGSAVGSERGPGLRREELGRLEARQVALKAWCPGAEMKVDEAGEFAPLVWVRPDGLVAFGADGSIRWRYHETTAGALPLVLAKNKTVYVRSSQDVLACDAETGTELWRWQPLADGRALTGLSAVRLAMGLAAMGNMPVNLIPAPLVNQMKQQLAGPLDAATYVASDSHVIVASANKTNLRNQKLHAINRLTGKEDWTLAPPDGWAVDAVMADAGRVQVVMLGAGGLEVWSVKEDGGEVLWKCAASGPTAALMMRALGMGVRMEPWAGQGVVVLTAAVNSNPPLGSLIFADGQSHEAPVGGPEVQVVAATAETIVFWTGAGYVATSRTGEVKWKADVEGGGSRSRVKTVRMVQGNGVVQVMTFQGGAVPPFVSDKTVAVLGGLLVAQTAGAVRGYDMKTGELKWKHEIGEAGGEGAAEDGAVLACGDMAAVFCHRAGQGELWFLDAASGKLLGTFALGTCSDGCEASLVRGGVYVDLGDELVVVRAAEKS